MQLKFLHAADIHLGYQQYGLDARYDDFSDGFQWITDTAIEERVAFLLIAGDLFEKRTLDPRTLLIAVDAFEILKDAGIPVVAIEGNHERTYGDNLSWMEYLNQRGLIYLLDCSRGEQGWLPQSWDETERAGGYIDIAGARIYGLRYRGAETGRVLDEIGAALAANPPPDDLFNVFLAHTSVENYFDRGHPFARQQDLGKLRQCVDYLALGHVHAPYRGALGNGDWLFNPGCPETWSSEEWQYGSKGAVLAAVDTDHTPALCATHLNYPYRRPFVRVLQELDACPSPGALLELLERRMRREPRPISSFERPETHSEAAQGDAPRAHKDPVVEVLLTGVARFSRAEIDAKAIEELATRYFNPLVVRIRSSLQEARTDAVEYTETPQRDALERVVFENLIAADDRFASVAADTALIAVALKQMVLDGVPSNEIAEEVARRLQAQRNASATTDAGPSLGAGSDVHLSEAQGVNRKPADGRSGAGKGEQPEVKDPPTLAQREGLFEASATQDATDATE